MVAMFDLGRQKGAMDFCEYCRGKMSPERLVQLWEGFQAGYAPAQQLSAPETVVPLPNPAASGLTARKAMREMGEGV